MRVRLLVVLLLVAPVCLRRVWSLRRLPARPLLILPLIMPLAWTLPHQLLLLLLPLLLLLLLPPLLWLARRLLLWRALLLVLI